MRTITVTEARKRFGALLEAAQHAPVLICRRNRDVAVIVSAEEYDRIRGVKVDELDRLCERVSNQVAARGLTDEILADLLKD